MNAFIMSKLLFKLREKRRKITNGRCHQPMRNQTSLANQNEEILSTMFRNFLSNGDDQRDFREFLEIVGLPDLNCYVDFMIQVHSLKNLENTPCDSDPISEKREKCLIIYHRYIRSYATEKVILDWPTKAKIETKIQSQNFDQALFDKALVSSAAKLEKLLAHFYEKRIS